LSNGGSEVSSGVLWNGMNCSNVNLGGPLSGLACSVGSFVSVIALENLTVLLNVCHGIRLPSTIASSAIGDAINELLFSKGKQFSRLDKVVSFHGAGG